MDPMGDASVAPTGEPQPILMIAGNLVAMIALDL
jgi:hypothetical protein